MSVLFLFQNKAYLYKPTDTGYKYFSPDTIDVIQIFRGNRATFLVPCISFNQCEEVEVWESLEIHFLLSKSLDLGGLINMFNVNIVLYFGLALFYSITFSKLQQFYNASMHQVYSSTHQNESGLFFILFLLQLIFSQWLVPLSPLFQMKIRENL